LIAADAETDPEAGEAVEDTDPEATADAGLDAETDPEAGAADAEPEDTADYNAFMRYQLHVAKIDNPPLATCSN